MSFAEKAYLGTLDDVVARYPWRDSNIEAYTLEDYIKKDDPQFGQQLLQSFNTTLQFNALFGRELLINDGYLLNHPAAKIALLEPDRSPLRAMIEGRRIQILRRNTELDLDDTALDMAKQNNRSFQLLTDLSDWPQFRQELRYISRLTGAIKRWPRVDISQGLEKFLLTLAEPAVVNGYEALSQQDSENLITKYHAVREADETAPRDAWEKATLQLFSTQRDKQLEAMQLANAYYHINFTLCLAAESPSGMAVETMSTPICSDLLEHKASKKMDAQDAFEIQKILSDFSGNMFFPDPKQALDGEKLCELYSGQKDSVGDAKIKFLMEIERLKNGQGSDENLRAAGQNYSDELLRLFQPKDKSHSLNMSLDGNFLGTLKAAGKSGITTFLKTMFKGGVPSVAASAALTTMATNICIDYGKRIAYAALPYIKPIETGTDSQFLSNLRNRNRLFSGLVISAPVDRKLAVLHAQSLNQFN